MTGRRKRFIRLALGAIVLLLLAGAVPLAFQAWIGWRYRRQIYRLDAVPSRPAAIVLGAGYWPDGRLSDVLADRMDTAIDLYRAGKVSKLFLTGDNRRADYNEPATMAAYALAHGLPRDALVLDYAGRRTYDSCYRARAIFGLDSAVVVTQAFHLPRSLYTCQRLGLDVVGVAADRHEYVYGTWYTLREIPAMLLAWLDVTLLHPTPVLGEPIPIDWGS